MAMLLKRWQASIDFYAGWNARQVARRFMDLINDDRNPLEHALSRAHEEPAMRPDFYRALLASEIYLIGSSEPGGRDAAGQQVTLMQWETERGERMIPFFTSLEEVRRSIDSEEQVLRMPGAQLMALGTDVPLVLNPLSDHQEVLSPDDVQALAEGHLPGVAAVASREQDGGASRQVRIPQPYPAMLVDALTTLFVGRDEVEAAWICAMEMEAPVDAGQLLIGLDLVTGSFERIAEEVVYVTSQVDSDGYAAADVMELGDTPLAQQIRASSDPFYSRRWGQRIADPLRPGHA